ncbi:MAG: carbohydrate ABC transporter permease [Bacilli bacterium]|nr:carbohydrate ABC transporter permease [Bacilli bacterium]
MKNNETTTLKRHRRTTFNQRLGRIFIYFFLSLIALMIILPFVQLVLASFKSAREINLDTFFPKEWKFSNYKAVFKETVILRSFLNTFTYIIPPVVVGTFMSALCAYGFARLKFPGKKLIFTLMMGTLVIPNIIIMVPAYVMFANFYKWLGTPLPVIIPGMFGSTVIMFFMMQYIRTLPSEMEEAAMIDGMSRGGIIVTIVFPMMVPAFIAQGVLAFSGAYNDYLTPLLYLGGNPKLYTVQLAINQMNSAYAVELEKLLAASVIALVPTIVLFLFAQKFFTEGITLSGLK